MWVNHWFQYSGYSSLFDGSPVAVSALAQPLENPYIDHYKSGLETRIKKFRISD